MHEGIVAIQAPSALEIAIAAARTASKILEKAPHTAID
jgi:hypothetical protein